MKKIAPLLLSIFALGAVTSEAQLVREGEGFEWGGFEFRPQADASVSYDSRVVLLSPTEAASDSFGEVSAGIGVRNLPARYRFNAYGNYGYRTYNEYDSLSDDFYALGVGLRTDEGKLNWLLSADYVKRLSYNTVYNVDSGQRPDSILSNEPNIRFLASGYISYDASISEKTSLVPAYNMTHYKQEFQRSGTEAEWQIHRVTLPVEYQLTDKTRVSVGAAGSLQVNRDEDGRIVTAYVGVQSTATEKTTYNLRLGYSGVNYELSGEDNGFVTDASVTWRPTAKVTAYVFGGNSFQPGYSGGSARMVYRVGYGVGWLPADQWSIGAQILHDYEQAIGDNTNAYADEVRHFFNGRIGYQLVRWAEIALVGRYAADELLVDQAVVSAELSCRF